MVRKVALLCVCLFVVPVWADDAQEVNRLLVGTVKLVKEASSIDEATVAVGLLEEAMEHLNAIVDDYPGTDAAVKLATGEKIGNLSLDGVQFLLNMARLGAEREAEKQAVLEVERAPVDEDALKAECAKYEESSVPPVLSEEEQAMLERYRLLGAGSYEDRERAFDELYDMEWTRARDTFFFAVSIERARLGDLDGAVESTIQWRSELGWCNYQEDIELIGVFKNNGHEESAVEVLNGIPDPRFRRLAIDRFWGGQEP